MTERPSYWTSRSPVAPLAAAVALPALLTGAATGVTAQSDPGALCGEAVAPLECQLAVSAARSVQPRVGLALWGGSPVPGTASTAGFRIGTTPRVSLSGRVALVPTALPPLVDRSESTSAVGVVPSASVQSTVELMHGYSPLPTVGGFLSLDFLGRVSFGRLPVGKGFDRSDVWGWAAGLRLGVLRESFTLPGVSVTATYGRSTDVTFGDPEGLASDGFVQGAVSGLGLTAAASRGILGVRLTGGVAWDRYGSDVRLGYDGAPAGPLSTVGGDLVMERWSGFGSITWSHLIYHTVLEIGWHEPPTPATLPVDVEVTPMSWWGGLAVRVTP